MSEYKTSPISSELEGFNQDIKIIPEKSFQETLNEALSDKNLNDTERATLLNLKEKFKKEKIDLFGKEYDSLNQESKKNLLILMLQIDGLSTSLFEYTKNHPNDKKIILEAIRVHFKEQVGGIGLNGEFQKTLLNTVEFNEYGTNWIDKKVLDGLPYVLKQLGVTEEEFMKTINSTKSTLKDSKEKVTSTVVDIKERLETIKTLDDLTSLIPLLDKQNISEEIKSAIITKVIGLLTAGFESSKDIDDDLNNINRIIPLGVQGIGDEANKSIMFGRMYKLVNEKLEEINPEKQKTAQNQQSEGTRQKTDTQTASSDPGQNDPITHAAADADASRAEYDKKLQQRQNNQYYNEKGAELKNNSNIIGEYTTTTKINKRDIHGNDIGNLNNGNSITTTGNFITLRKEKFLEVKEGSNTYYVAANYLARKEDKADTPQTNIQADKQQKTASGKPTSETAKKPETDNKDSQATSPENVEVAAVVTPSISGDDFNKAIQARGKTITLGNGTEIRKVTNGFRVTENDVSYRISEKSVMEKGNRFYKSPTDINKALLSAKNTETAKEELAKIKDEIDKLSMTVSEFFTEPLKPHEQAWIDTLSGDKVTLNVKSVIKNAENDTVITFDIDDFGFNDKINSNFQYKIGAQGIYSGNDDFKQIVISELQKKVYEEPKREEILVEYEKIKDALNNALQNPNQKQEIGEMYNEKITIEFDGKQFYAQIGSDNQIGLTQITHSSTEITFPEGYLNTVLKDAIEGKIQDYTI